MSSKRKLLSALIVLALLISVMPVSAFASNGSLVNSQFPDMPDDWSTPALESAIYNGLLNGIDGKIVPDENLTRAQMATIVVRAFGAIVKGDITAFPDVKPSDWFSDYLAKAYQMGIIKGADGKMKPDDAITREEVFVILARALKLAPSDTVNKNFLDLGDLSTWAKGETYSLINSGYINGSNGYLFPKQNITRAETAQMFFNIIKQYFSLEGTYTAVDSGNIMVNAPDITLKDVTVSGDLIVGDGVGDGDLILDNVKIDGRLVVRGGGENSIIIRGGSSVASIIVSRVDGAVSVKVQGDANVEVIYIDDGSDDVRIEGSVGTVEVAASGIAVTTEGATIENMRVTAADSTVVVGEGSTVKTLEVAPTASNAAVQVTGTVTTINTSAAGTHVTGSGKVAEVKAQVGATGSKIETPSTKIVVDPGVTGVTGGGGTEITPGSTSSNNASGTGTTPPPSDDGGYYDPTVAVSAISVDKVTTTLQKDKTEKLTVTFSPSNATNKNITWSTSDARVATVAGGVVTGIKTGTATVTATSNNGKTATCVVTVVEEDVIAATVDYAAVWNEARGTWYIKVTVPENDLDESSVESITVIKEAGVGLAEPRSLTPDTDKVMWFGVAKADADLTFKAAGEYAYKVVRQDDDSEYIFNFNYKPDSVTGVTTPNVLNTTQNKGYDTIQAAITAATAEDTIQIGAGTFDETLSIDKSITILGVNAANDARTEAFLDAGSIVTKGIDITAGDVTIKGLTIQTKGILASNITELTLENNRIENISEAMVGSPAGSIIGLDVKTEATGPILVNQNSFSGIGIQDGTGTGVRIVKASNSITITNNIIEDVVKNGINIYNLIGSGVSIDISNNTIENWDSDQDSNDIGGRAIRVDLAAGATITVTGNTITPNDDKDRVDDEYVKITGVHTDEVGNLITQLIGSNTWTDNPDFSVVILVNSTNWGPASITKDEVTTYYDSIGAAITAATAGDTIQIGAGTFDETLSIDKSLTILGVNANNDATTENFLDDGSIVTGGIDITAGNVTIKGLTIQTKGILASNITGLTVVNNRIEEIGEAMEGSPAGSIIGLDVKTEATGPIVIEQNRFSGIGEENGTGTAIRIVRAKDSITITDNIIEDVTKNGINIYNLIGSGVSIDISNNTIENWDSDQDSNNIGGRAIRVDLVEGATITVTENTFTPNDDTDRVDDEYVKITGYTGDEGSLITQLIGGNTWTDNPDFSVVILVNDTTGGPAD